jgi:hypothetical protein
MSTSSATLFTKAEHMTRPALEAIASWHGLCFVGMKDQLLDRIIDHISKGMCASNADDHHVLCFHTTDMLCSQSVDSEEDDLVDTRLGLQIRMLNLVCHNVGRKALLQILKCSSIPHDGASTLS